LFYVPAHGFTGEESFTYRVSDVHGQASSAQVSVRVRNNSRAGNAAIDTDLDGFPDEFEVGVGTLPGDRDSKPDAFIEGLGIPLTVTKCTLLLKPEKESRDKLAFRFLLPIGAGYEPDGQRIEIAVGGVHRSFTLDAKGRSVEEGDASLRLRVKRKKGVVQAGDTRCDFKIARADLAAHFVDEALETLREQKSEPRAVSMLMLFGDTFFEAKVPLNYTSKSTKKGKAKLFTD